MQGYTTKIEIEGYMAIQTRSEMNVKIQKNTKDKEWGTHALQILQ